jgi:hypothetical protein
MRTRIWASILVTFCLVPPLAAQVLQRHNRGCD